MSRSPATLPTGNNISAISGLRRGGAHGADAVRKDIHEAEALLGIPVWPHERAWKNSIRTEAWNSNQTECQAWTGTEEAGIALAFDHSADSNLNNGNCMDADISLSGLTSAPGSYTA